MDTSFLFDEFFVTCSVYTVYFVAPSDHTAIVNDLIQLSQPFALLVLLQKDFDSGFVFSFVSSYSLIEFHNKLFVMVNKIRSLHTLNFSQFHYL